MESPLRVAIVGCGAISGIYLSNAAKYRHLRLEICADVDAGRAQETAEQHGLTAMTVDEVLASDVDIVVNLTPPAFHSSLNRAILESGKHAYCEKPLGIDLEEGRSTVELAREKGLRIGCAPDTVLGAGISTARLALDDGWIGEPVGGTVFLLTHGPEGWHPNPGFYYERGGGPLFDMGPYYLSALVQLLGPVRRLSSFGKAFDEKRVATSAQHWGKELPVEVETSMAGVLEFHSGALVTAYFSFDVWKHQHNPIEIYGRKGSLRVPDPNTFGGPVELYRPDVGKKAAEWQQLPLVNPYAENSRYLGVADLAAAVQAGREARCNGEVGLHVLEIMSGFVQSAKSGSAVEMVSCPERPLAMPDGAPAGML